MKTMACRRTRTPVRRGSRGIRAAALLAFLAAGCQGWAARILVEAPNRGRSVEDLADGRALPAELGLEVRVPVGPPGASLSVWILDPAAGGPRAGGGGDRRERPAVLVLHGWRKDKSAMLRIGRALAAAGYRAVLVDLRGNGA